MGRKGVVLILTDAQVAQVLRDAAKWTGTGDESLPILMSPEKLIHASFMEDRGISRSLLFGLAVLALFPADGGELGITELAKRLGQATSTTHRYVNTLLAAGLVQQNAKTSKYHRVPPATQTRRGK